MIEDNEIIEDGDQVSMNLRTFGDSNQGSFLKVWKWTFKANKILSVNKWSIFSDREWW